MRGAGHELAAGDGAEQDGHEGGAFDQRVAGRELSELELVRQHGVFHGAEQGGDDAEQRERREQQRHRVQEEAGGGKGRSKDLGEFEPPRDDGFDVFVGELAAEPRQDEIGEDEDGACDRHQRVAVTGRGTVKQDDDECVLEHVVIERREKLRPEQRREAA